MSSVDVYRLENELDEALSLLKSIFEDGSSLSVLLEIEEFLIRHGVALDSDDSLV